MILINNKDLSKLTYRDVKKFLDNYDEDESFFIEFKNNNVSSKDLVKEICAFSNTYGGYIFLGVEDNKQITGCPDWTEERINNIIRDSIDPTPIFDIRRVTKEGNKIYIIKVEEGTLPPYLNNKGIIYERLSSSSFPIKNNSSINRMWDKRKENLKRIENKIYISPLTVEIGNLCGYIDFGFSVASKDLSKTVETVKNVNYEEIAKVLSKTERAYSISKVGFSISIFIGESRCLRNDEQILSPAGLGNFMEILPDGSVRCRILLISIDDTNQVPINNTLYLYSVFEEIYNTIFKKDYSKNFIEARCYEKLNVIKSFEPKIKANKTHEYYDKIEKFHIDHINKYGGNLIFNSNRVPDNDFYVIDKKELEKSKIKYNDRNLINELFKTCYFELGFIDILRLKEKENTDEN